ncbi:MULTISPECIES: hypothetical protein [Burkholderia cepacia complex]|uniref:DUF1508 domain-containing protein n=1 Tax=Burkholderia cenocepacia TaxID=95486 RepID=A0ABD4U5D5_9BURK|nr:MULTISPECIES: hypothetical protein [Burkholderia cepacia complex]MCW3604735.1 hypothetical protein [Burkholderia cenocepacia]MCW3694236.1 hypothetical protein [Burkholderia cenocepacia]MCW3702537.1 hypothetical protein [Burkholderia cenocepacia]MCW3709807.1 hypothetical protein [Burkholderia cenocepacia]MCW3718191.1 hypothetical protein [Burkholderia cenocepacia]
MSDWVMSDEGDFASWVRELDPRLHSLDHKRACVWQDETTGTWLWEIESYRGEGLIASGTACSREQAMAIADAVVDAALRSQ